MNISLQRAYEVPNRSAACRVLVDRVWPRGIRKDALAIDEWMKEIAPSNELRKWFGHDPRRWEDFKRHYAKELEAHPEAVAQLVEKARRDDLTLVYAAKDRHHNNAVALRDYLCEQRDAVC